MTVQHTPGPWIICDDGGLCIHSPEYGSVGQVWTHLTMQSDGSVEGANARLIAAAPDLLEALADAVNELQTLIRCDNPNNPITNATTDMRIDRALTAIRKARGEDA